MLGLLQSPDGVAVQVKIELEVLRIPQNAPFIPLQSSLGRRSLLTRHSISDGGRRRRQPSTFNIPISLTFSGLPDVFTQLISISRQISHSASPLKGILGYFQIVSPSGTVDMPDVPRFIPISDICLRQLSNPSKTLICHNNLHFPVDFKTLSQ
jgi:hypothetical protein